MAKFLFSRIKDGHLYVGPSPAVKKQIGQSKFFPAKLYFQDSVVYVSASNDPSLPVGSEVTYINGKAMYSIKKELLDYIVSDGNIKTKKNYVLDNYFHLYYRLIFGEQEQFRVAYKDSLGKTGIMRPIAALHERDFPKIKENVDTGKLLQLSFKNQTAIFTIKTFDKAELNDRKENFPTFLERSFAEIKQRKCKNLVLDLRGNGGGRDLYGSLLYSYLIRRTSAYYKDLYASTTDLPFKKFSDSVSSYNNLNKSMLVRASRHGVQGYRLKKKAHPNLKKIKPKKNHFKGQVWVLTNGLSFSTTSEFCSVMKRHNRARFVGEETGGAYEGNSGMTFMWVLPNTGIPISFGLIEYDLGEPANNSMIGRGVIPDYTVKPTIKQLLSGEDVEMEFVLKKIADGGNK